MRLQPAEILRWVVVAVFVGAGSAKLLGFPSMVELFNAVAMGQWLRYVVGICELTGAALLAFRRTALLATFLLSGLLIGAAATEMVVLRRLPLKSRRHALHGGACRDVPPAAGSAAVEVV